MIQYKKGKEENTMEWFGLGIALIVAAWVYSDAKERGSSSPILWAFGVFAMLIIFLPLYLIMRPSRNRTIKLCPHCGKYYNDDPFFCPHCGKETAAKNKI